MVYTAYRKYASLAILLGSSLFANPGCGYAVRQERSETRDSRGAVIAVVEREYDELGRTVRLCWDYNADEDCDEVLERDFSTKPPQSRHHMRNAEGELELVNLLEE